MHTERRRAPRYSIDLQIGVNGGTGVTKNLSDEGVCFETDHPILPGGEVEIVFPLEHAAPVVTRATCTARVLRVEKRVQTYSVAARYEAISFETR